MLGWVQKSEFSFKMVCNVSNVSRPNHHLNKFLHSGSVRYIDTISISVGSIDAWLVKSLTKRTNGHNKENVNHRRKFDWKRKRKVIEICWLISFRKKMFSEQWVRLTQMQTSFQLRNLIPIEIWLECLLGGILALFTGAAFGLICYNGSGFKSDPFYFFDTSQLVTPS